LAAEAGIKWSGGGGGGAGGKGWDVEAGPSLMPPQPAMTRERALLRTVAAGDQVSDADDLCCLQTKGLF
jgi:hypothetical protein